MKIMMIMKLGIIFLGMFLEINTKAESIKSKGELHMFPLDGKGGVYDDFRKYTTPFLIRISDDGRFFMQIGNSSLQGSNVFFTHDGSSFFYQVDAKAFHPDSISLKSEHNEIGLKTAGKSRMAYLSAEEIPMFEMQDDGRDALWYALCSGHFFRKHGTNGEMVNLFANPRSSPSAYGFGYEASFTETAFPFARRMSVLRDFSYDKASFEESKMRETIDLESDLEDQRSDWEYKTGTYEDGQLETDLGWRRSQRLEGHLLPLEIMITNYFPYPRPPRPGLRAEIYLEDWEFANDDDFKYQPPINGRVLVKDARLRRRGERRFVDYATYILGTSPTNMVWHSTNEVWLQNMFRAEMSMNIRPDRKMPRGFLMAILFFAIVVGILLIAKKTLRKKVKQ